jgi:ribosomal-protein-alanine N-acetyltransferase
MVLYTQRLILRPFSDDDKDDFYEMFSSKEVARFISPMTLEDVEKYFAKMKQSAHNPFKFAVVLKENNKMIGTCEIKVNNSNNFGELSYVFNPKYWNKGYCTEACKKVVEYAFENGLNRIEADCFEDNFASIKILQEKLNMDYEGSIKNYACNHNKILAFKFFGLTKENYLKRKLN